MSKQRDVTEEQLSEEFARCYHFVNPHLKEGFKSADGLSSGLSPEWNALLFGPNDGGRDSFRNLTEHLSSRAAAGSCRLQTEGQAFSWGNSHGCRVEEPHPGVYVFKGLFSKDWCAALLEEIDHMQSADVRQMEIVDLITRMRPNSMNNYGVHLNIVGMRKCMDDIMHNVLQPLAMAIFMSDHRDVYKQPAGLFPDQYVPLRSHHSFTIRYSLGEDTDLSTHRDDSDVTLNVCLGKQFTGGSLFFCNTGVPQVDFNNPMQMPPTFDFDHEIGTAVVHLGRLQHGARPIASGTRCNLIMWGRTRPQVPTVRRICGESECECECEGGGGQEHAHHDAAGDCK